MMKKIIVLTDLSPAARSAAELALVLAGQLGYMLVLANAWRAPLYIEVPDPAAFPLEPKRTAENDPHEQLHTEALRLRQLQHRLKPALPAVIETISYRGELPDALREILQDMAPEMIVIGHDAPHTGQHLKNSLTGTGYPLLIVPVQATPSAPVKTITFATALDAGDARVLSRLKKLCDRLTCRLTICHVSEPAFNMASAEELKVAAFMKSMRRAGLPQALYEQYYDPSTRDGIENFAAKKQTDILALVHHEHHVLWSLFHESQEEHAFARCRFPLLLMPQRWS